MEACSSLSVITELHQITPDFSALEDFLAHRYHFWSDDIDHDDPFICPE